MNCHYHLNILKRIQLIQIMHVYVFILLSLSILYCHAFQQINILTPSSSLSNVNGNSKKSNPFLPLSSPSSSSSSLHSPNHSSKSHHPSKNTNTNLFATSYNSYNSKPNKNSILSPTARESAVIVEWEPVSELQRRIEDGIHYEHYEYDPLCDYGSEEKKQMRKEYCREKKRNRDEDIIGNGDDDCGVDYGIGIFCGFTVTKEEMERLKSAHP